VASSSRRCACFGWSCYGDSDSIYVFNEITLLCRSWRRSLPAFCFLYSVSVLREGNVIEIPAMKLEVAEACSGIRSFTPFLRSDLLWLFWRSHLRRAVLGLSQHSDCDCAMRCAFSVRVVRPVLGSHKALGFFHSFPECDVFVSWVSFLVHRTMCLFLPKESCMRSLVSAVVVLLAGVAATHARGNTESDSRE